MPGRKKPNSAKQKKATLQDKRAAKRGEVVESSTQKTATGARTGKKGAAGGVKSHLARSQGDSTAANKVKALQSRFLKLSPIYLARTQAIAFNVPLPRPIPPQSLIYQDVAVRDAPPELLARLTCPRRPKWRYGMTKKEVERNEEGLFVKWMDEMQEVMSEYLSLGDQDSASLATAGGTMTPMTTRRAVASISTDPADLAKSIRSPSYYEQNLEVWRQLWRVTEQSNILLVLMDIRCPPVHFPASLRTYLRQQRNKRIILVLTKVDLVSPSCVDGWKRWCREFWHSADGGSTEEEYQVDVIPVESYKRESLHPGGDAGDNESSATPGQGRPKHVPHIPPESLRPLITAIQRAYRSLTTAPEVIREDQGKMEKWNADLEGRMKTDVDWEAFERVLAGQEHVESMDARLPPLRRQGKVDDEDGSDDDSGNEEEEEAAAAAESAPRKVDFLTLGLVGQPNVGKSSLLNALLGEARVTASKTPGKTKHFQSLFWSRDVRIVDCPGLVLPSFAGVETQVMAGILPISQIPSLPACIHHAAKLMPIERILNLPEPKRWEDERRFYEEVESKKTGRDEVEEEQEKRSGAVLQWMAGDIMTGWAEERGFLMRMIAEGRIPYRYFAPGTPLNEVEADIHEPGDGIWCPTAIGQGARNVFEDDQESDDDEVKPEVAKEATESDLSEEATASEAEDESEDEAPVVKATTSRFAALMMDEADEEASDSDDDDDDD